MNPEKKLEILLEEHGRGAKAKLAKFLKVSPVYVTRWVTDSKYNIPRDKITSIESYFDLENGFLLGNKDKVTIRTIPLIGLSSCGIPNNYDLNGYEPVPVSSSIYKEGMYAVQAEGNSMTPKINDRNIVYCNAQQHINNGDIVHYSIDGDSGIKKYKMNEKGDTISLVPLNMDYDVISIHADEHVVLKMAKVVGVVDTDF